MTVPLSLFTQGPFGGKSRGLENILAAINHLAGVEFVIAGWYRENDRHLLTQISETSNAKFKGLLKPSDALALEASSDAIIALYEPNVQWYNITLPNKVFSAMMCGVPLITNISSHLVKEVDCGIIVDYDNIQEIKNAIVALKDDPKLRLRLGQNALHSC